MRVSQGRPVRLSLGMTILGFIAATVVGGCESSEPERPKPVAVAAKGSDLTLRAWYAGNDPMKISVTLNNRPLAVTTERRPDVRKNNPQYAHHQGIRFTIPAGAMQASNLLTFLGDGKPLRTVSFAAK